MRQKLLITGFEPFGKDRINPSWEAVKRLPDVIGGFELLKLQSTSRTNWDSTMPSS